MPRVGVRSLAALNPGRRAVKALAVVAVVVVAIAAFLAWRSQPTSPNSIAPPVVAVVRAPAGRRCGIAMRRRPARRSWWRSRAGYAIRAWSRLPSGARVADAIAAAGGALPGTDLSFVNLARKVADGELIVIGKTGPAGGAPSARADRRRRVRVPASVDLNTATAADLDTLPGHRPGARRSASSTTAPQHGGFHSVDELRNVSGIGDAKFAEIKDLVTV